MQRSQTRERLKNIGNQTLQLTEHHEEFKNSEYSQLNSKRSNLSIAVRNNQNIDSLQIFQDELNQAFNEKKNKNKSKRSSEAQKTRRQKGKNFLGSQKEIKAMENRLEKLMLELEQKKSRQSDEDFSHFDSYKKIPFNYNQSFNPFMAYPPFNNMHAAYQPMNYNPYYPPPPCPHYYQQPQSPKLQQPQEYQNSKKDDQARESLQSKLSIRSNLSEQKIPNFKVKRINPMKKNKNKNMKKKFRIAALAIKFIFTIKKITKKLSEVRKKQLENFWNFEYEQQMADLKDWLLQSQRFSIPLILQKRNLNFVFFNDRSSKVKQNKIQLLSEIVTLSLLGLLEDLKSDKISSFSEFLAHICKNHSFVPKEFWTAVETQQFCISQKYGFLRLDSALQNCSIVVVVFIKVLIFNILLQLYRFGEFPKNEEPFKSNMKMIASIFYMMMKEILEELKSQKRNKDIYQKGNWLKMKPIPNIECCFPFIYEHADLEEDEHIYGLFDQYDLAQFKKSSKWEQFIHDVKTILKKLHQQVFEANRKMKQMFKQQIFC